MSQKTTKPEQAKLGRRQFLMGAGAGVAAAGAALVVSKVTEPVQENAAADGVKESKGYQLSEHVKTYYRTLLV